MPHGIVDSASYISGPVYWTFNGGVQASNTTVFKSGLTQSPASVSNPKVWGYRRPAPWYKTLCRWEISEAQMRWVDSANSRVWAATGYISEFHQGHVAEHLVLDPSLANDVMRKVLSQMSEQDVAFNAFMLQGKQSLKMVANLATGIAEGTDRLLTADFKKPKSFRKFLANAGDSAVRNFSGKYLEYLYGWKPLADDVENAFQHMIDGYTGPEQKRFRLKVKKSRLLRSGFDYTGTAAAYFTNNSTWTQHLYRENRAKVVLHYEFPSQAGEMLPTMTPFGTAWEAAPWSFVIDWFIPIGDWIGAMEATQFAIFMEDAILTQSVKVAAKQSDRSRWVSTYFPWYDFPPGTVRELTPPPMVSGQSFKMTREVLSPYDVLDRTLFPSFSSKFGLPQASQALALLSQVTKKWF